MKKLIPLYILLSVLAFGCGPAIYKAQGFDEQTVSHKTLAILPVAVQYKLKPREKRKTDSAWLKQEEENSGMDIQGKMYKWFLKNGKNYSVSFQDIARTNEILNRAGIQYDDIETKPTNELAGLLGVDVVFSSTAVIKMPVKKGVVIAQGLFWGPLGMEDNEAEISIAAFDTAQGGVVWRYEFRATRSALLSMDELVNALMKNVVKNFPYKHN
jgi:hypothetical protein